MVNRTTKIFTIIIFTAIAAITLGNSSSEKLFAALGLPNPIEDWEIEIILNNYQMQQVWKAQDSVRNSWPAYSDARELLLKELTEQFDLENLSNENLINTALTAGGLFFSDSRLKSNKQKTGASENGYDMWFWTWSEEAKERFGLDGESYGVMFNDVAKNNPEAVSYQDGYGKVNYEMIGVSHGS